MLNILPTVYLTINTATYMMFMLDKMSAIYLENPESKRLNRYGIYKITGTILIPRSRTPESTLLLFSFLGGAPGALISMLKYHHKTRKLKFRILIPLFILLQLYVFYIIFKN